MELESMEHEEKLVELLGLKLVGPTPNFSYNILNEDEEVVGFIQYKRVKREKGNLAAVYGYHMVIENEKISYDATRSLKDDPCKFYYVFDIKSEKGKKKRVRLNFENHLSIIIKNGHMEESVFTLNNDAMYLNFRRDTYKFHKEELVTLTHSAFKDTYQYQMRFCTKEKSLNKESETTIFDIEYREKPHDLMGSGKVYVETNLWREDDDVVKYKEFRNSTLEEEILSHKRGIESVHYFRQSLNEMLPFKEDILTVMLENYKTHFQPDQGCGREAMLFFPELKLDSDKKLVK